LQSYRTDDGYRLGQWVSIQRANREKMNPGRRERLEALPGWSWDVLSDQWEEGFSHLKKFSEREGHCRVHYSYKCDDGYRLGQWVKAQRGKKDRMAPDRQRRLEALPGWVWRRKK
jgi:Helicase associated domain